MDTNLEKPLISIIMPAYNTEKYIAEAIESVLRQTYKNWELLIVNDGSTDFTQSIIEKHAKSDIRIKYFYQKNGKQGKARNLAISNSKGYYLAFLDADDIWQQDKLKKQLFEIVDKDCDLVFSKSYILKEDYKIDTQIIVGHEGYLFGDEAVQFMLEQNRIPILTVLVKKEKVAEVGCFSEKISIANAEDYHLWLKLIMTGCKMHGSSEIFTKYRVHSQSATASDKAASRQLPYLYNDLIRFCPNYKNWLIKRIKQIFYYTYENSVNTKKELVNVVYLNTLLINKIYLFFPILVMSYIFSLNRTKEYLKKYLNT
jgi:teichuronic acid biosynthesis glycosyltransferase TuaG